jgi:hypothetical protein
MALRVACSSTAVFALWVAGRADPRSWRALILNAIVTIAAVVAATIVAIRDDRDVEAFAAAGDTRAV